MGFSFWRLVGGLGVGIAAVIAPAYIAEVSPAHLRGRLGSLQQLAIAIGLLVSFISNYVLANIDNSLMHLYGAAYLHGVGCY